MATETYMEVPVVEGYATRFAELAQTTKDITTTIEGVMAQIRDVAFVGECGHKLYKWWTDEKKPLLEQLSARFENISKDIRDAIKAYRDGDYSGSQHFVGGGQV
jgi:uncharacterized protein YukE